MITAAAMASLLRRTWRYGASDSLIVGGGALGPARLLCRSPHRASMPSPRSVPPTPLPIDRSALLALRDHDIASSLASGREAGTGVLLTNRHIHHHCKA